MDPGAKPISLQFQFFQQQQQQLTLLAETRETSQYTKPN
jgi:hypothetical protein